MQMTILPDADAVARQAATIVAAAAREAVAARGRCILAVSGGHTPWHMLGVLAKEDLPWDSMHVVQVDERVAPAHHPDRNLTHLRDSLLAQAPLRPEHLYAMPVESAALETAARRYALTLQQIAGVPPVLDLVHLGLGPDGHTASLVPGDPVLPVTDADVAVTGVYQERRRMTLTYPILNRARRILWLVTGQDKVAALIHDHFSAKQGVEDDHLNILCMGGRTVGPAVAWDLVQTFLAATFSQAERHLRRLGKVAAVEAGKA